MCFLSCTRLFDPIKYDDDYKYDPFNSTSTFCLHYCLTMILTIIFSFIILLPFAFN